jgi:hypothetical protein
MGGLHPGAADTTAARAAKRTVAAETMVSDGLRSQVDMQRRVV